ncbi:MAG: hypothetical protein V3V99_05915 [candidate division Zixibacteria bacterium]
MKRILGFIFLFCVIGVLNPVSTLAQESGTIQAIATVVSSLQVIGINNLNFGTVTPGVNKSVNKADAGFAGEWQVNGTPSAQMTVDIAIPPVLMHSDSSATLIVTYTSTDASYDDGTGGGQSNPSGTLDPNGQSILNLGPGGTMNVWIGGTAQPTVAQTGGNYSADVVLSVAYTGN